MFLNNLDEQRVRSAYFLSLCFRVIFHANLAGLSKRARLWDQVTKCTRWMPWRLKAMKDVVVCDKPRGADNKL